MLRKRLFSVPGRPVISNYGTPTEKVSEFLHHHLKPIMQNSCVKWSDLGQSQKAQGKSIFSFPCTLSLHISDT